MSREAFHVTDTNPNDTAGAGGCACSLDKCADCVGPFVVFPNVDTESVVSPYTVIGANCLRAAAKALDGETLAAGEHSPLVVNSTAVDDDVPEV